MKRKDTMWKIEREGDYFKIYDEKKNLAGYFAPDYGDIYPAEKADEIIDAMHKNREKITGGYLMVPMVKFGIFNEGQEMDLAYVMKQIDEVRTRLSYWADFISERGMKQYRIMVSHTDHDMLSITLRMAFSDPVPLERSMIQSEIGKTMNPLHEIGLL